MIMIRRVVLFGALFFVTLQAGAGFATWLDLNPAGMSPASYLQAMQHGIGVYGFPLFTLVLLGVLFTIVSAVLSRRDRPDLYLLVAASTCGITTLLITNFVILPINLQMMTFSTSAPPPDLLEIGAKWWGLHTARMILQIVGAILLIQLALGRRAMAK